MNLLPKLLSGRLWLTLIAGGVFAYVSCTGILESQAVAAILVAVFTSYFQRTDRAVGKSPVPSPQSPVINPPAS